MRGAPAIGRPAGRLGDGDGSVRQAQQRSDEVVGADGDHQAFQEAMVDGSVTGVDGDGDVVRWRWGRACR